MCRRVLVTDKVLRLSRAHPRAIKQFECPVVFYHKNILRLTLSDS